MNCCFIPFSHIGYTEKIVVKDTNFESLVEISVLEFYELKKGGFSKAVHVARKKTDQSISPDFAKTRLL